jgi:hypothetical protein
MFLSSLVVAMQDIQVQAERVVLFIYLHYHFLREVIQQP